MMIDMDSPGLSKAPSCLGRFANASVSAKFHGMVTGAKIAETAPITAAKLPRRGNAIRRRAARAEDRDSLSPHRHRVSALRILSPGPAGGPAGDGCLRAGGVFAR